MSDEYLNESDDSDGDNSRISASSSCSSKSPPTWTQSDLSTSPRMVYRGGGDHGAGKHTPTEEEPIRLAWKSIRCYRATNQQSATGGGGGSGGDESVTDREPPILRDVSGYATAKNIVLIAGMTPLAPLTLLRVLAGKINPDRGQVVRGGTVGLENMTVSMDDARGNGRRGMLFDHLTVEDSVGSYVNRALPEENPVKRPYPKRVQETIGNVIYPVTGHRETRTPSLPEYMANFISLNMVLRCARQLILLDEPFIGLRFWQVTYIIAVLKKLRGQGCTIIVSSSVHATLLLKNADRIYLFDKDGSLILQGRPSNPEVFKRTATRTHTFAQTVSRIARFRRNSTAKRKREETRLPQQLEILPRTTRGMREGAATFSEIMLNEITSDVWLLTIPVICSVVFAAMCALVARGRTHLMDKLQPFFDMNMYFFLQLFIALQSLHMGFQSTRCFAKVANREWRNASYTLGDGLWALSSISTTMSTLCTSSVTMFVFLVTGQQQIRGENAPGGSVASAWAPFLFTLAGLLTAYNFGRLGFLLASLYDTSSSRRSMLLGHLCLLVYLAMAIVPCRLFMIHGLGLDGGDTPIGWRIAAFLSPLSAGQDLMFYAVYATQHNVLCPEWLPSNDTSELRVGEEKCVPYSSLAGIGNSNSFVLMPVAYRAASVVLWTMTLCWFFGTLVWARRIYDPFLKAVPDMHRRQSAITRETHPSNPIV